MGFNEEMKLVLALKCRYDRFPKITISAAERNFCVISGPLSKYMAKMAMLGEAKCTLKRSAIYFASTHVSRCMIASSMTVVL